MQNFFSNCGECGGYMKCLHGFFPFIVVLLLWSLFWKGLALWYAGRRGQPWWFVIILVVNTVGILEIVYLFAILKIKFSKLFKK